jgi:hypothetical protein
MLPNWIGLGPGRTGTTTLYEILKKHDEIFLTPAKECNFFCKYSNLSHADLPFYESNYFDKYAGQNSVGEISPQYFTSSEAQKNIFNLLGCDIKFVVTLRNPVERALSHYKHVLKILCETRSFDEAMSCMPCETNGFDIIKTDTYIQHSLYYKYISQWLEYFPLKNFLFLIFENDIVTNLNSTLHRICEHLCISKNLEIRESVQINRNLSFRFEAPKIMDSYPENSEVRLLCDWDPWCKHIRRPSKYLIEAVTACNNNYNYLPANEKKQKWFDDIFYHDVQQLEQLIQIDLSFWRP